MPLDLESFPMRLFRATQERAWLPSQIDFSQERNHWMSLNEDQNELLARLIAGFRVGERGVTHELAPLQAVLRDEGRLDEEMYVTAQMFEEARHVEFFETWITETLPGVWGKDIPYPQLRGDMFSSRLPEVMRALHTDPSPAAQMKAIVLYHLYIEGVGAESSYPMYFEIFDKTGLFPALEEGISLIRRDEARHIAFGTYLLQRLLQENPDLDELFQAEMEEMRPFAEAGAEQTFEPFEGREAPFGLQHEKFRRLYQENFEQQKRNVYDRKLLAAVV